MYDPRAPVLFLILTYQTLALLVDGHATTAGPDLFAFRQGRRPVRETRYKRDDEEAIIGYFIEDDQTSTYTCPNGGTWAGGTSILGDTYGHCTGTSASLIATFCSGNTVYWTTVGVEDTTASGWRECKHQNCITVTIYDSYDGGSGSEPQYWIDCDENLLNPEGVSEFYRTMPEPTTTESTESISSIEDPSTAGVFDTSLASSTTSDSSATATEESDEGDNGLSGGAIAGIVVGSVIGGMLFTSAIVLAFWMGKRRRRRAERELGNTGVQSGGAGEDQAKTETPNFLPAELGGSVPPMQPIYTEGRS